MGSLELNEVSKAQENSLKAFKTQRNKQEKDCVCSVNNEGGADGKAVRKSGRLEKQSLKTSGEKIKIREQVWDNCSLKAKWA